MARRCTAIKYLSLPDLDEDPDYIEIICGQGIDYSGYDLIEEFLKTQAKQGATHDQRT